LQHSDRPTGFGDGAPLGSPHDHVLAREFGGVGPAIHPHHRHGCRWPGRTAYRCGDHVALTNAPQVASDLLYSWLLVNVDWPAILAMVSHPRTTRFLGSGATSAEHFARFCRSAGSWLLYGYGAFTIRRRDLGQVIGNCGIFHTWRGLGPDFDDMPEAG